MGTVKLTLNEQKAYKEERAVVYARYSSHSQGEQSIEGQLAAAKKYAADHNYTIVNEYIDRATTGRNDNREAFQKMLSDCAKRLFSVIIVWKVDRFGRNREEVTFNKYKAKKHGVRVEYVAENLGAGPESIILESVLEGMAEYYSVQLSQNIMRGRRESAKKHLVLGPVPLGYTAGADRSFVVDPAGAAIVKRIYSEYLSGKTMEDIVKLLNAEGLKTQKGTPFSHNSLFKILHNEKYIGIYDYNNGEVRDENAIPAILDKETFYAVQELTKQNTRARVKANNRTSDYLLTGKLFCGKCGGLMVGESGTSKSGAVYNYYLCQNHKRGGGCKQHAIRQDIIEKKVLDVLLSLLDDEKLEEIAETVFQYYQKEKSAENKVVSITSELDSVKQSIAHILKAIEAGAYTPLFNDRLAELNAQQATLERALYEAQNEFSFKLTKDHFLFYLTRLRDGDASDPKVKKGLLKTFVNSVYYYEDDGKLAINVNCTENNEVVTLEDINKADKEDGASVRLPSSMLHSENRVNTRFFVVWERVTCGYVFIFQSNDKKMIIVTRIFVGDDIYW